MTRSLLLLLSLVCAGLLLLLWIRAGDNSRASAGTLEPAARSSEPSERAPSRSDAASERTASADTVADEPAEPLDEALEPEEPAPVATPAGEAHDLRGRVVDAAGVARAGIAIGLDAEAKLGRSVATSDAEGAFEIARLDLPATLIALDPSWSTVASALVDGTDPPPPATIVVAPAIDVGGIVVDADGTALVGARVVIEIPEQALAAVTPAPELPSIRRFLAATGRDGRFRLAGLPSIAGARMRTRVAGCIEDLRDLPRESTSELWIELAPDRGSIVKGIVEQADGTPARGATIRLGRESARALADGTFRIVARDLADDTPLEATAKGRQPARIDRFGAEIARNPGGVPPVRLVLGGPSLSIEGHVLDQAGVPQKRWQVEATPEGNAAGAAPSARRATSRAWTDKSGHFELGGLSAGRYKVRATSASFPLPIESEPVEAATRDLVLTVPKEPGVRDVVRGRVIGESGEPAPGVRVVATADARRNEAGAAPWRQTATSSADGSFELRGVPRERVHLELSGAAIIPVAHPLDPADPGDAVLLHVAARTRVRFEASSSSTQAGAPDAIGFADEAGHPLPAWAPDPELGRAATRVALDEHGVARATVGASARSVIVFRAGAELGRRELPRGASASSASEAAAEITVRWD
jgi:hypothetical protein